MKRVFCVVISAAILLLCGCSGSLVRPSFYCTQEAAGVSGKNSLHAYDFFQKARDTEIVIPGLKQGFVPQGICCWEEKSLIFLSGYFMPLAGGLSAVVLALDSETGKLVGEYSLTDSSGRDLGGHFSGVAVSERDLFVTGRRCIYRIPLSRLSEAGARGAVQVEEVITLDMSVDSCNYSQEMLWTCEYYQADNYPLEGRQGVSCADSSVHHAWMIGFAVEDGLEIKCVMTIPDKIQGITCISGGNFMMSQSYGRKNPSLILVYRDPRTKAPDATVELSGEKVPLWNLDSRYLVDTITAPPMSEGCCATDGGAYILFESAAYYYNGLDPEYRSVDPLDTIWFIPAEK